MEKRDEPKRLARIVDRSFDQSPISSSTPRKDSTSQEVGSRLRVKQCSLVGSNQLDLFVLMELPLLPGSDPLNEGSAEDIVLSLSNQLELFGVGRKGFL